MSVLRRQDGITPHLTAAKVCIHVWDRQPSHWHGIKGLKTHPVPPQMDSEYSGVGSKSDPHQKLGYDHY